MADKYELKKVKSWPVIVDPKLDGVRVITRITPEEVFFASRNGNEFPALNCLSDEIRNLYDLVQAYGKHHSMHLPEILHFDGEAVTDLNEFNASAGQLRRHYEQATNATLLLFDVQELHEFKQAFRRYVLKEILDKNSRYFGAIKYVPCYEARNEEEIFALYNQFLKDGYEGAMVKDPHAPYLFKRNRGWLKVKPKETFECRITGKFEGQGKYVGMLGGWFCEVLDSNHQVCGTVKVGGGFLDLEREAFWHENHDGRIIEVSAQMKTPDGSLRHPNFIRFRDDL